MLHPGAVVDWMRGRDNPDTCAHGYTHTVPDTCANGYAHPAADTHANGYAHPAADTRTDGYAHARTICRVTPGPRVAVLH